MNAKENRVILLRTMKTKLLNFLNQISQTRLEGIVLSFKVTFADDKLCHTPHEQQTQVITLYKLSHQECLGEIHS